MHTLLSEVASNALYNDNTQLISDKVLERDEMSLTASNKDLDVVCRAKSEENLCGHTPIHTLESDFDNDQEISVDDATRSIMRMTKRSVMKPEPSTASRGRVNKRTT